MQFEQWIPHPLEHVFQFFSDMENLPRIMPRWMDVRLEKVSRVAPASLPPSVSGASALCGAGSELEASFRPIPLFPVRIRSAAIITRFEWNQYFEDVQEKGPFQSWHHRHEFAAEERSGTQGTIVRDIVNYEVRFAVLGSLINSFFIAPQMRRTFRYRQIALQKLL